MAAAMRKVGDGIIHGLHLLANYQHLGVEVFELLFKTCLNTLESLPYALLHSPMLPPSDALFISVKDGIIFIT